jgi:hypothetical protein
MLDSIQELRFMLNDTTEPGMSRIGIELNTSCPNIAGRPPPAYDPQSLAPLLAVFRARFEQDPTLTIGLKLAPYVHAGQFQQVVDLLAGVSMEASDGDKTNCVAFLSCTNTIGSSVVFQDQVIPVEAGTSSDWGTLEYAVPTTTGGLGGEPIHALSLGYSPSCRLMPSVLSSFAYSRQKCLLLQKTLVRTCGSVFTTYLHHRDWWSYVQGSSGANAPCWSFGRCVRDSVGYARR